MPNSRKPGWRTSTYSAPAELIDAAKVKATEQGTDVSVVIRKALARFVR